MYKSDTSAPAPCYDPARSPRHFEGMEPTGVKTTAVPHAATSENFPDAISSNAEAFSVVMPDRSASFMSESFVMDEEWRPTPA